jgi:hypothetical protein
VAFLCDLHKQPKGTRVLRLRAQASFDQEELESPARTESTANCGNSRPRNTFSGVPCRMFIRPNERPVFENRSDIAAIQERATADP